MYGEFLSPQISDVKIYLLKYETLAREFLIMDIYARMLVSNWSVHIDCVELVSFN